MYVQPTLTGRLDLLKEAAIVFGKHKATPFFQKSTEEQAELLEVRFSVLSSFSILASPCL